MSKIYALLVGINDYAPGVGKLRGCLNDVDHVRDWLTHTFDRDYLHVEVLKDGDATREALITQFRKHLGRAGKDDVVYFHYSGHGARWASAPEFKEFYPDGKDEGLVCYDSRRESSTSPYDLADKELAVLISDLAKKEPHIAVTLDCCHSGSGTRDVNDFAQMRPRVTHEVFDARPLDSYIDGRFAKMEARELYIPTSRHILLAACDRVQKAWEGKDHSGVFTSTLLEVLDKSGGDITYADLFMRCRSAVRTRADNQDPQFETYLGFNANTGFLGRAATHRQRRFNVFFENGVWKVDAGALHGLPSEPEKPVGLELYTEGKLERRAGTAFTTQVGPQKSELKLSDTFKGDPEARYRAEITSLPVPPLPVAGEGGAKALAVFRKTLADNPSIGAALTDVSEGARYVVAAEDGNFLFKQRETGVLIQGALGQTEVAAQTLFPALKQVVQWERALALQNHATRLDTSKIEFALFELLDDGTEHLHVRTDRLVDGTEHARPNDDVTLDFVKKDGAWPDIRGKLKVRNGANQDLHVALFYFSGKYGIWNFHNEPVPPSNTWVTIFGDQPNEVFFLEDDLDEVIEHFQVIVSTEKVDGFLLEQEDLELGTILPPTRGIRAVRRTRSKVENDWITKRMEVRLVRQQDRVRADRDAALAGDRIVVKGHPSLTADLSLGAAKAGARSIGEGPGLHAALERNGFELVNFSGTRGRNESILDLTDIHNVDALNDHPLEIELDLGLKDNEFVLPLAFNGDYFVLGGHPEKTEDDRTLIKIYDIPDGVPDNRRSLGKALKLYFVKTYLGRQNVNQLRWVAYGNDGTVERHAHGVREKVAEAENVLLLVHGIIGDTENMAEGLRLVNRADGGRLDEQFDLVLTYDYENLHTGIRETAGLLKDNLAAVGLQANDGKRLTLLAHSMGGLVSRWFIEQEGGNEVVDHLVMCGTPNGGSPFGKIGQARALLNGLTTVAINLAPAMAPLGGALIYLLNRSKKLTRMLEEMDPESPFITALNAGPDPGTRYTILAGNISAFEEDTNGFMAGLVEDVGKSFALDALFGTEQHDIAVGTTSIQNVVQARTPAPINTVVACHHLNYFSHEPSLEALAKVAWNGGAEVKGYRFDML